MHVLEIKANLNGHSRTKHVCNDWPIYAFSIFDGYFNLSIECFTVSLNYCDVTC